jgi:hypothetical protein
MRNWASRPDRLVIALLIAGAAGCDSPSPEAAVPPPPPGFPYASAAPDCAPWDGAAISILLAAEPGSDTAGIAETVRPLLRVAIYPRDTGVTGRTYRWPADPQVAAGLRCEGGDSCEVSDGGEVTLLPAPGDTLFEGSVRLHFADGATISGGFRATWHPRRILCG